MTVSGQQLDFVFSNLQEAVGDVQVQVNTRGDINSPNINQNDGDEYYVVTAEGSVPLGNTGNNPECSSTYRTDTFTILQSNFNNFISGDGTLTIEADATASVNTFCDQLGGEDDVFVRLVYTSVCPRPSASPSSSPTGSPTKEVRLINIVLYPFSEHYCDLRILRCSLSVCQTLSTCLCFASTLFIHSRPRPQVYLPQRALARPLVYRLLPAPPDRLHQVQLWR